MTILRYKNHSVYGTLHLWRSADGTIRAVLEQENLNPQPALMDRAMDELLRLKDKYFFKNEAHHHHEASEEQQGENRVRRLKTLRLAKLGMRCHSGQENVGIVAKLSALGR